MVLTFCIVLTVCAVSALVFFKYSLSPAPSQVFGDDQVRILPKVSPSERDQVKQIPPLYNRHLNTKQKQAVSVKLTMVHFTNLLDQSYLVNFLFFFCLESTRRYSPLHGLTSSSCGWLRPLAEAFFALWSNFHVNLVHWNLLHPKNALLPTYF